MSSRTTTTLRPKFLKRVKELEDYKKQEGNCEIPNIFPQNQGLANWVRNQRYKFASITSCGKQTTPQQYIEFNMLRDLGFAWTVNTRAEKTLMFEATVKRVQLFKTKHPSLWETGNFNHCSSDLPEGFQDLTALCQDMQELGISKSRKHTLKRLRVKLLNTESTSTLVPAAMGGDVVFKEGGETTELENVNTKKGPGESTSTLPAIMGDVVLKKGGETTELENVNTSKKCLEKSISTIPVAMVDVVLEDGGETNELEHVNTTKKGPEESISTLPVDMGDVVLNEGGEKPELENVKSKKVQFQEEIPKKLRRSKRSMKK